MTPTKSFTPQAGDEGAASFDRRTREGYYTKYFVGEGIDIGCGKHTIVEGCRGWDLARGDGDATLMNGVPDASYDWVYASHVLEHLEEPQHAMLNWWRILRPGGHLIVAVPDEDLYEQGMWPSVFNPDHRTSWTTSKGKSWSPVSRNLVDLIRPLEDHKLLSLRVCDERYEYGKGRRDQAGAERQVEAVVQKVATPGQHINPLAFAVQCTCGSPELMFLGVYRHGNMLVRCPVCGQKLCVNMAQQLTKLGFLVQEPSYVR